MTAWSALPAGPACQRWPLIERNLCSRALHLARLTGPLPCLPVQVQDDDVYMVLNAGCAEKDLEHMERQDEVFKVSTGWRGSQL